MARSGSSVRRCCPRSFGLEAGARECVAQQSAAAVSRRAPGSGPKLQAGPGTGRCPVGVATPVTKTGASLGGEVHRRWHGGVSGPKTSRTRWSWRNQASRPTAPIREVAMADAPLHVTAEAGVQTSESQDVPESCPAWVEAGTSGWGRLRPKPRTVPTLPLSRQARCDRYKAYELPCLTEPRGPCGVGVLLSVVSRLTAHLPGAGRV